MKKVPLQLFLLIVLLIASGHRVFCFHCQVSEITTTYSQIENQNAVDGGTLSSTELPIRFYIDYTTLEAHAPTFKIKTQVWTKIKNALDGAAEMFQALLSLKQYTTTYFAEGTVCDPRIIMDPSITTSPGVKADIILFPFFSNKYALTEEVVGTFCLIDKTSKRPLAGILEIHRHYDFNRINSEYYLKMLFFHQITHILAFHSELFQYFQLPTGSGPALTYAVVNGMKRTLLSTPKVVLRAREHFDCPTLTGVELENQENTEVSSHWESRIMLGDYMIIANYGEIVISEITLAWFEDSGWYNVNYYTGGLFRYGKHGGCEFLQSKCIHLKDDFAFDIYDTYTTNYPNEFCIESGGDMCMAGRTSRGFCYMRIGWNMLSTYQYYSNPTVGGLEFADFCPISFTNSNSYYIYDDNCNVGKEWNGKYGEIISNNSICVISSVTSKGENTKTNIHGDRHKSVCLPSECDLTNEILKITIKDKVIDCPKKGGRIEVPGYKGEWLCPDYNLICTGSVFCVNIEECITKKSTLLPAVYDYDPDNSQIFVSGSYLKPAIGTCISFMIIIYYITYLLI